MTVGWIHIISPVIGLFFNAAVQVLGCRCLKDLGVLRSVFFGFICGILCVFAVETVFFRTASRYASDALGQILLNAVIYAGLGYCYFHFINLGETARRIRIIRELYDAKTGLSPEEILNRYDSKAVIERRIGRLLHNGQILHRNGRYFIGNSTMVRISRIIQLMKYLLLGKKSEFD